MANIMEVMSEQERLEYGHLIMKMDNSLKMSDVILDNENKAKIEEFVQEQAKGPELAKYGLYPMNRILLQGESGTGKSMLVKAMANDTGRYLLYVDISQSLTDGNVSKNIATIFKLADKYKNCIVFFDEFDSIALSRDGNNGDSGEIRRALNSTFLYLDAMHWSNIFCACTNLAYKADRAILTRFNLLMRFKLPELSVAETAKKFLYKDFGLVDDVEKSMKEIIDRRCRMSYRELRSIVDREMKKAVINGTMKVHTKDLYETVARQQNIRILFSVAYNERAASKDTIELT